MVESLNKEDKIEISEKLSSFAFEKLQEAKGCLKNQFPFSCIHQCYYACFNIIRAVLYLLGIETKNPDETYKMASLYIFMKTEEGKELIRVYSQIRDMCNYVDYDAIFCYSIGGKEELIKDARDIYQKANYFVKTVETIRKKLLSTLENVLE